MARQDDDDDDDDKTNILLIFIWPFWLNLSTAENVADF